MNIKQLLANILKESNDLIGVDIGKTSIKSVYIEGDNFSNAKLKSFAIDEIPQNLKTQDGLNIELVSDFLKEHIAKLHAPTKNVATFLPQTAIKHQTITGIIIDDEDEAMDYMTEQMLNYIPVGKNNINLDYQKLDQVSPTEAEFLLVAAKKENIEYQNSIFESAGLTPTVLDVKDFLVENSLHFLKEVGFFEEKLSIIFDFGDNTTQMYAFKGYDCVYTKDVNFGGESFVATIMSYTEQSREDVIGLINNGIPQNLINDFMAGFISNMAMELHRAIQFFVSATASSGVDLVMLSGGLTSAIPELDILLEKEFKDYELFTKVEVINPFEQIQISEKINKEKLEKNKGMLLLATGLALRKVFK